MWLIVLGLAALFVQAPAGGDRVEISGQVVEASSQAPISEADVSLVAVPAARPAGRPVRIVVVTDAEGRFVIRDVGPGAYSLSARKAGFAAAGTGSTSVNVTGTTAPPITLTLQLGGAIVGHVLDERGQPLADIRVVALHPRLIGPQAASRLGMPASPPLAPVGSSERTNDRGEFRLHSLAPGEYAIQAAPGVLPTTMTGRPGSPVVMVPTYFPGTADVTGAQRVTIRGGETSADLTIRMVTMAAHEVTGVVVDQIGAPIANAMVRLDPNRTGAVMAFPPGPSTQTKTDARGAFVLGSVVDGAYTIVAAAPVVVAAQAGAADGSPRGLVGGIKVGSVAGTISGSSGRGGFTMTETQNGVTVQYTDKSSARVPVIVNSATVSGVTIVVARTP